MRLKLFYMWREINSPPQQSGIYIMVADNVIQYIGKTINFKNRITRGHFKLQALALRHNKATIYMIRFDPALLPLAEQILIRYIKPPYNELLK